MTAQNRRPATPPGACVECCGPSAIRAKGRCAACYERHRRRMKAYGQWDRRADQAAAHAHVTALRAAGLSNGSIAAAARIAESTVRLLGLPGQKAYVSVDTETRLLAVPIPATTLDLAGMAVTGREHVAALGAQRRLRALAALGWPPESLAARKVGGDAWVLALIITLAAMIPDTARPADLLEWMHS